MNQELKKQLKPSLAQDGFLRFSGFSHFFLPYAHLFSSLAVVEKIPVLSPQMPGYSATLDFTYFPDLRNTCFQVANNVIKALPVSFIMRPRVVGLHLTLSRFDPVTASSGPTRAFLWHRDCDDYYSPQLKIMVPMVYVSSANGMFSSLSKQVCPLSYQLIDVSSESVFRFLDDSDKQCRIRDDVIRRNYGGWICDFDAAPGDVFLVDTNSVYHKGGMVTDEYGYRVNVQITIGSCLHS